MQQIARNINIGPSPKCLSIEKLAEEVQHIGNSDGIITKDELLKWISDVSFAGFFVGNGLLLESCKISHVRAMAVGQT